MTTEVLKGYERNFLGKSFIKKVRPNVPTPLRQQQESGFIPTTETSEGFRGPATASCRGPEGRGRSKVKAGLLSRKMTAASRTGLLPPGAFCSGSSRLPL